jgi:hypothetical protein
MSSADSSFLFGSDLLKEDSPAAPLVFGCEDQPVRALPDSKASVTNEPSIDEDTPPD